MFQIIEIVLTKIVITIKHNKNEITGGVEIHPFTIYGTHSLKTIFRNRAAKKSCMFEKMLRCTGFASSLVIKHLPQNQYSTLSKRITSTVHIWKYHRSASARIVSYRADIMAISKLRRIRVCRGCDKKEVKLTHSRTHTHTQTTYLKNYLLFLSHFKLTPIMPKPTSRMDAAARDQGISKTPSNST